MGQKQKNNYIQPSTIENYTKSLYYYYQISSTRKWANKRCEIDYNNLNLIQTSINYIDNEYIRNNTRIESTCETQNNSISNKKIKPRKNKNISMSKILNPKKQVKLKGNKNHHHSCDLFNSKIKGNSTIINLKIIKIQTIFKGYLVRKKVNKKLKRNKQYNKGFNKMNSLLLIFKKNAFVILKNNYINGKNNFKFKNEICDEISISININRCKNEENNQKENIINNIINNEKDIKNNNINNENVNISKNYIEDSTNTDSNKFEVNNNENEKEKIIKFDELNNNYQNIINEKKQLEEKLSKTNDDYNKLKEKIKEYEENNTKYNDILIENQKIKEKGEEIITQNEKLIKEIQSIKNDYNKLLQEHQKISTNNNTEESDNFYSPKKTKRVRFNLENDTNETKDISQTNENEVKDGYHKSVSVNILPKRRRSLLRNKGENFLKNSLRESKLEKVKETEELHFTDLESNNSFNSNNTLDEELERKQKDEKLIKLENLFWKKDAKIKKFMKTYFSSFYYNGIYYKMVGKYPRRSRSRSVIYNAIPSGMILIDSLNKIKINNNYNNEKKEDIKEDDISQNANKEENQNNIKENIRSNEIKDEDIKSNENNNGDNKSENSELKNQLKENLNSRIQKARGLRKLLTRKGSEKKEKLRKYFFKFYQAGILSKVRSVRKVTKKYLQRQNSAMILQRKNLNNRLINFETNNNEKSNLNISIDLNDKNTKNINDDENNITTSEIKPPEVDKDLNNFLKRSKTAIIEFDQKQKESEEKRIKKLEILFYKVDRIYMKIIRNVFQKYYLRSKLESINLIEGDTKKKKFKRKKSKKFKKAKSSEKNGDKKDEDKKEENQEEIN